MQTQPAAQPYYPYQQPYPYPYPQPQAGPQQGNTNGNNNQQQFAYPQGGVIGFIPVVFFPCINGTVPTANGQTVTPAAQAYPAPCQQCTPVQSNTVAVQQQQQVNAAPSQDTHARRRLRGRRAKNNLTDKPIIDVDTIIN